MLPVVIWLAALWMRLRCQLISLLQNNFCRNCQIILSIYGIFDESNPMRKSIVFAFESSSETAKFHLVHDLHLKMPLHFPFNSLYLNENRKKNVNIVQLNWIVFCMNISEEWYVFTHTPLVLYLHVSRMLFTMAAGIQIKWKSTLRQCKKKEREMNVRALTTRRRRLVTMLWSIQWKRGLNWGKKKKRKLFDHVSLDKHWFFFHYYLLFCF